MLPFVREAEPIVRKQIRPFTRIAQPYVRNLGNAARDLTTATPELTTSVGELNRFVNIGAFNPIGRTRPLAGRTTRARASSTGWPGRPRTACRCTAPATARACAAA